MKVTELTGPILPTCGFEEVAFRMGGKAIVEIGDSEYADVRRWSREWMTFHTDASEQEALIDWVGLHPRRGKTYVTQVYRIDTTGEIQEVIREQVKWEHRPPNLQPGTL